MKLISLNLEQPQITASGSPQTVSISDTKALDDLFMTLRTDSGEVVTPEKARRCSAVLACMRGISEDLSSLPLVLMKRGKDGDEPALDHPLYSILASAPNPIMTSMEVREHMIFDLMLFGGFFNLINVDSAGDIDFLWPLSAAYVTRLALQLSWTFTDPLNNTSGEFTSDTVWRGTIMSNNCLDGTALTLLAREAIGLLLAAEKQGARLFAHGVQSDLVLQVPESATFGDDEKAQLRAAFMEKHSGSFNAFMPFIAEGGTDLKRIGLTAQESQYIEARKFQIEDIARVFRYPEVLLGNSTSGRSSTYASAEQFFQSYVKHTLTPWAVRIEQTAGRDLLSPTEKKKYYIKHDFDSLLRGDTAARFASYNTAILSGIMQPAEARKKEGWPYMPGLNYFVRPAGTGAAPDGGDAAKVKPTDENAIRSISGAQLHSLPNGLARRVAEMIYSKEQKALVAGRKDAEIFYAHFGGFLEDLTGADVDSVSAYLEMRRTTSDRFSPESRDTAISTLISLCKKDN